MYVPLIFPYIDRLIEEVKFCSSKYFLPLLQTVYLN